MPIPGSRFKTKMLLWREMSLIGARQTDDQEDRTDENVKAVEARRHIESRTIVDAGKREWRDAIFIGLDGSEHDSKDDRQPKARYHALAIAADQRVMGPGHGCTRT
mgnify:CR=1 FL=1